MAAITAKSNFDAGASADRIYYAMKGKGCNEEELIKILTEHSEAQREEIKTAYDRSYGKDLERVLKDELKGNLETVILGLMTPRNQYIIQEVKNAFKGIGAKEDNLFDLLLPASNAEIVDILERYRRYYDRDLIADIKKELKGAVEEMFVAHLSADRDVGTDDVKVAERAHELKQAIYESKWSSDSGFVYIFTKSSYQDLKKITAVFERLTGQDLETVIKAKTKGDMEKMLLAFVQIGKSIPGYFAERLNDAMTGRGCDDKTLIRILLLRAEVDILKVKDEYKKMYGRNLEEAIQSETKGDYQKMALALIN